MALYDNLCKVLQGMDRMDELNKLITNHENSGPVGTYKEVLTHTLEIAGEKATLIPLSDLHLGQTNFNLDKLITFVRYILNTPDTYTILLGDQQECATRTSVGLGIFDETMHVREQLKLLYEIFKPLADAKKLLGIHIGNHEYRIPKEVGLSPAEILATELGVPYLGFQGYHVLKVNSLQTNQTQVYNMMSYHGTGAGSTIGSLVNAAERGDKVCTNCDLYISGHTHAKNFHVKTVFNLDQATASLVPFNRYYVICGSFLEYWGSYAEMKLLPPQETGAVMITLNSSKKEIKISY